MKKIISVLGTIAICFAANAHQISSDCFLEPVTKGAPLKISCFTRGGVFSKEVGDCLILNEDTKICNSYTEEEIMLILEDFQDDMTSLGSMTYSSYVYW